MHTPDVFVFSHGHVSYKKREKTEVADKFKGEKRQGAVQRKVEDAVEQRETVAQSYKDASCRSTSVPHNGISSGDFGPS